MIDQPRTEVVVSRSEQFKCDDADSARLIAIADRVAEHLGLDQRPGCRIEVVRRAQPHFGLGSGTQLSLATAEAICQLLQCQWSRSTLSGPIALRGQRSAVGVHGYFDGGLIYEAANTDTSLNPIQQRVELPQAWTVALFRPADSGLSVSGELEAQQFQQLASAGPGKVDMLRRLITKRILPAAASDNFDDFAAAVHHYNESSGRMFESVQGGAYNGTAATNVIGWLIDQGAQGVGQSSWGPGIFAWFDSAAAAKAFTRDLPNNIELMATTKPRNEPRQITTVNE